jgi:hypothetical protein
MGCKHVVGACERLRSRAEVVEGLVGVTFEGLYTNSAAFCLACGGADEMVGKRGAREQLVHLIQRRSVSTSMVEHASASASVSCVCLLLQDLLQSCSRGGGGDSGGHVLRETTSRGLCGLVCPSRTSERGGEGDCVKEGGGEEGEHESERAMGLLLCHSPRH